MKITEKTRVHDAIKSSANVLKVLEKYGLDCAGCKGAVEETVEKLAINNGLDVKTLVRELNRS